eukprot:464314_1
MHHKSFPSSDSFTYSHSIPLLFQPISPCPLAVSTRRSSYITTRASLRFNASSPSSYSFTFTLDSSSFSSGSLLAQTSISSRSLDANDGFNIYRLVITTFLWHLTQI